MLSYCGKRLLQAVPLLIGVSLIGFGLMHLAPGGPLAVYTLNPTITAQDIERIKIVLGLDLPVHLQYLKWASGMLTGNWGTTLFRRTPRAQCDPGADAGDLPVDGHGAGARGDAWRLRWDVGRVAAPFAVPGDYLASTGAMSACCRSRHSGLG